MNANEAETRTLQSSPLDCKDPFDARASKERNQRIQLKVHSYEVHSEL